MGSSFSMTNHTWAPREGLELSRAEVKSALSSKFCPHWTAAVVNLPRFRILSIRLMAMVKGCLAWTLPKFPTFSGLTCNCSGLSPGLPFSCSLMNKGKRAICHSLDFSRIGK